MNASELYVVKTGEFEVLQRRKVRPAAGGGPPSAATSMPAGGGRACTCTQRMVLLPARVVRPPAAACALRRLLLAPRPQGVNIRVNMKRRGDVFGEVALMFNSPRSATVAATQNSVVWVLERDAFRQYVREVHETESSQLELFLNSGGCCWAGVWVGARWCKRGCCRVLQLLDAGRCWCCSVLRAAAYGILPQGQRCGCRMHAAAARTWADAWQRWQAEHAPAAACLPTGADGCKCPPPLPPAVPILASLSRDEKLTLLDAFEEKTFRPGDTVVRQVCVYGGRLWLEGGWPAGWSAAGWLLAVPAAAFVAWGTMQAKQPHGAHLRTVCKRTVHLPASTTRQGDPGDLFYVIKDGEASVYQVGWCGYARYRLACLAAMQLRSASVGFAHKPAQPPPCPATCPCLALPACRAALPQESEAGARKRVNQLFKADFFGEGALLADEPRCACSAAQCTPGAAVGVVGAERRSSGGIILPRAEAAPAAGLRRKLEAQPGHHLTRRCHRPPPHRGATVEATSPLVCLTLDRATFTAVLGPLQQLMSREKSAAVTAQRLMKLQSRGGPSRVPAEVMVRRRRRSRSKGTDVWEVIRARGHLDEVLELRITNSARNPKGSGSGSGNGGGGGGGDDGGGAVAQLVLTEGNVLGGGAFSRVSVVTEQTTGRTYALKRMRKSAVVQCPEHVFCEQSITRNLTHPFCIRQYASFQVGGRMQAGRAEEGWGPGWRWYHMRAAAFAGAGAALRQPQPCPRPRSRTCAAAPAVPLLCHLCRRRTSTTSTFCSTS